MKKNIITVKGKSEKTEFSVDIPREELIEFFTMAMDASQEELDAELATSPGGFSTALFTAMMGAKHREAVGWDLVKDGWVKEKAWACFAGRLERKVRTLTPEQKAERLAASQKAWDEKLEKIKALGLNEAQIAFAMDMLGKRPEAK